MAQIQLESLLRHGRRAGFEVLALVEAAYCSLTDSRLSRRQKALLIGALTYFLSPVDAFPDLLPGGFLDDIPILIGAIVTTGAIGREHLSACRKKRGLWPSPSNEELHEDVTKTSPQPEVSHHSRVDSGNQD